MSKALINVGPGGPMEAGIASARHKESVLFWHDGENVAFRNLGVEKGIGYGADVASIGAPVVRIAQAFVAGERRVYFQDSFFRIWGWDEGGLPYLIGVESALRQLEPYGNWLAVGGNGLKLWKNGGALVGVPSAPAELKLLARNSKHLLGCTDSGLHWADIRDIEDWTPSRRNTARSLPFRDLESSIIAVKSLSQSLGVYTKESLRVVGYNGQGFWFGERYPVNGIGAISANSIIEAGFKNYGITRQGVFVTDGTGFQYIDTPPMHGYLEEVLDWEKADEIFGFHNEPFGEVVWFFPDVEGVWRGLAYKYTNSGWTKYRLDARSASDRDVFDYPIFGTNTGIAFGNTVSALPAFARTKPLDANESARFKFWDYFRFVGEWDSAKVKIGLHDRVNEEPIWVYDGELKGEIFEVQRESVFLTLELYTDSPSATFSISQIFAAGEPGGELL